MAESQQFKMWTASTLERGLGYVFGIFLATQLSLLGVSTIEYESILRGFMVATALQVLLVAILFDVIVHDERDSPPQVRTFAAVLGAVWNTALTIAWGVIAGLRSSDTGTLFEQDPSTTWTIFVLYATGATLMSYWVFHAFQNPTHKRPYWKMTLVGALSRND